jgi:hypothetical protein
MFKSGLISAFGNINALIYFSLDQCTHLFNYTIMQACCVCPESLVNGSASLEKKTNKRE